MSRLSAWAAAADDKEQAPYLPYISPISPLYLPHISQGFRPEPCGAEARYGPRAAAGALREWAGRVYEGSRAGGGEGGSDGSGSASSDEGDSSASDSEGGITESPFLRGITIGASRRRQRHAKPRRGGSARSGSGRGGKPADNLAAETAARIASACAGDDSTDDEGFALHAFTFDRDPSIFDDVG